MLFHVRVTMWIGLRALASDATYAWIDRAMAWITLPFPLFGTAVMLFFVVSGFAIHYPYSRADAEFVAGPYVIRRFFRIYPPYLVAVLITALAEYLATTVSHLSSSPWSKVAASVAMVQNYVPPAGQMSGNPSLWSLPVEVELYLTYPILLWFWRRAGTARMLACVSLVSALAAAFLAAGYEWPMGNFAKYWIIWASGAVLAQQMRSRTLPVWRALYSYLLGAGLVLAAGARIASVPFGFEHFIWGGIYFLVVLWGLNRTEPLRRVPARLRRSVLFLGDISYSLYLVHFPMLLALGACWLAVFGHKPLNVIVPLIASLAPIPLAYVMGRFVERPSQVWGRMLSHPSMPVLTPSDVAVGS